MVRSGELLKPIDRKDWRLGCSGTGLLCNLALERFHRDVGRNPIEVERDGERFSVRLCALDYLRPESFRAMRLDTYTITSVHFTELRR